MSDQASKALAKGHQKLLGHLASLAFAALIAFSFSIGDLAVAHIDPVALTSVRLLLAVAVMDSHLFGTSQKVTNDPGSTLAFRHSWFLHGLLFCHDVQGAGDCTTSIDGRRFYAGAVNERWFWLVNFAPNNSACCLAVSCDRCRGRSLGHLPRGHRRHFWVSELEKAKRSSSSAVLPMQSTPL